MKKDHSTPAQLQGFGWLRKPGIRIPSKTDFPSAGMSRRFIDRIIGRSLFFVALFAIIAVLFIITFLLRDGYQIFLETGVWE
ncbi:MAG: phosphate ABC transporter permease, partial [Methanoculleus sp.]|nr:phosphate ABC transporter permease [Methanoculleus sp.]